MLLTQKGIQIVAPALQTALNQVHVDGANGRLCVPTESGLEQVSTEAEAFLRLYQATLRLSLTELPEWGSDSDRVPQLQNGQWCRSVGLEQQTLTIKAGFSQGSGRYLNFRLPLCLDARPEYQMLSFGVERAGIKAGVHNYVQSGETGVAALNIQMGFQFHDTCIAALASEVLTLSPFTALHQVAIQVASQFYVSGDYFSPGPGSRLRLLLSYEHHEHPESIALQPSREGLVPAHSIMTAGLKKFHLGSISEEGCYFNIAGDMEQRSLEVYCNQARDWGGHSLVQRPMPALLWDFVREQTGVSLDKRFSESA